MLAGGRREIARGGRRWGALAGSLLLLPLAGCGADAGTASEADPTTAEDAATAAAAAAQEIEVLDGWVRSTRGTDDPSMTGAFMRIENTSTSPVTLVSATAEVAGMVEVHEMVVEDGDLVMQRKEGGLQIPAGETAVLEPGFDHIMLMGLQDPLRPGEEVQVTLAFADGIEKDLVLPVKKFTEEESHYHEDGTAEHDHQESESPAR